MNVKVEQRDFVQPTDFTRCKSSSRFFKDVFEGLVISNNSEFGTKKLCAKSAEGVNKSEEFLMISRVVVLLLRGPSRSQPHQKLYRTRGWPCDTYRCYGALNARKPAT